MSHPKSHAVGDPLQGNLAEAAAPVITVNLETREVVDHDEVEIAIPVEVHERTAVGAAPAFGPQAGVDSRVGKVSVAIVQQQAGRVTVIGVIVWNGHLPVIIRAFVLAEEEIQVAIVVDIAAGDELAVLERRFGFPDESAWFIKCALGRTLEQEEAFRFCAEKIGKTVSVEVSNHRGVDPAWRVFAEVTR